MSVPQRPMEQRPDTPRPHRIELATSLDVPAITAIANRAAEVGVANFATEPEPVSEWLHAFETQCRAYPWLVARHDGALLGFAKAGPHRARGAYRWTAETPAARGDGTDLRAAVLRTAA